MTIPVFLAGDLVVIVHPSGRRPFFLDGRLTPDLGIGGNSFVARCAADDCRAVVVIDMTKACAVLRPETHCEVWRAGSRIWPTFDVTAALPPISQESQ